MEAAVTMPGYRRDRQGRVQGLTGVVVYWLRGERHFEQGASPCVLQMLEVFYCQISMCDLQIAYGPM